jgi:hypothetical protein
MEHRNPFKNKSGSNPSNPFRYEEEYRNESISPLLLCVAFIPLTTKLNRPDCGYKVHGTEENKSLIVYG